MVIELENDKEMDEVLKLIKRKKENFYQNKSSHRHIDDAIKDFYSVHILNEKENILQYWKKNKKSRPELYLLSKVILAVPASQVSVESAFSILKYI